MLTFDIEDERIKSKPVKLILRMELEPPHRFRSMNHPMERRKGRLIGMIDVLIIEHEYLILMRVRLGNHF